MLQPLVSLENGNIYQLPALYSNNKDYVNTNDPHCTRSGTLGEGGDLGLFEKIVNWGICLLLFILC